MIVMNEMIMFNTVTETDRQIVQQVQNANLSTDCALSRRYKESPRTVCLSRVKIWKCMTWELVMYNTCNIVNV